MDKGTASLIKGYIEKAQEKLKSAKDLFENSDWNDCVSRAYYCVFHTTQAILLTEGLSADTHRGLLNLFGLHFIKTGKLNKKFGKILSNLKDNRENGDYEVFSVVDKEIAERSIKEAEEFLQEAQQFLKEYLNYSPNF